MLDIYLRLKGGAEVYSGTCNSLHSAMLHFKEAQAINPSVIGYYVEESD